MNSPHRNSLSAPGSDANGTSTFGLPAPRSALGSPRLIIHAGRAYFVGESRTPLAAMRSTSGWDSPSRREARSPSAGAEREAQRCSRGIIGAGGRRKAEEDEDEHDGSSSSCGAVAVKGLIENDTKHSRL